MEVMELKKVIPLPPRYLQSDHFRDLTGVPWNAFVAVVERGNCLIERSMNIWADGAANTHCLQVWVTVIANRHRVDAEWCVRINLDDVFFPVFRKTGNMCCLEWLTIVVVIVNDHTAIGRENCKNCVGGRNSCLCDCGHEMISFDRLGLKKGIVRLF